MTKTYNPAVSVHLYLGSGKAGAKLRENLEKRIPPRGSLSEVVVELLRKADPALFKGVDDGQPKTR